MQTVDPDVRLMLAFRDGDESAFATLYQRWSARLLRYLERIVRDNAVAEELLQDTFLRVLDARGRYAPEARFSTWLFHIARNLACNELARARSRYPHLSTDGAGGLGRSGASVGIAPGVVTARGVVVGGRSGADGPDGRAGSGRPSLVLVAPTPGPDDHADARREHARFAEALAELPERQRTALWLAVVEGQAYEEIAALLGSSVQSVKNLVHRARANLADRMHEAARPAAAENER